MLFMKAPMLYFLNIVLYLELSWDEKRGSLLLLSDNYMTTTLQRFGRACLPVLVLSFLVTIGPAQAQFCPATVSPAGLVSYCLGDSVKLTASGGTGVTYQWRKNGAYIPGANSQKLWAKDFGSYDVKISSAACGNNISNQVLVGPVSPPPQPDFTYTTPSGPCDTTGVQFSVINPDNGLVYHWDFGDGATATGQQVNHVFTAAGTATASFTVQVMAQLNQGCSTPSLPQLVTVNALPDPSIADTISGFSNCTYSATGYTFDLEIINTSATAATNTGYVINWGDGSSDSFGSNFTTASHSYTTQGAFLLSVTATNAAGCSLTKTYPVFNGNNPSFGVASQGNTNGCGPITYTFDILNTAGNTPSTTYTFQFDDGTPPVVFNHPPPAQITHTFENPVPGSATNGYTLTAFASNACGTTPATVGGIKVSIRPQADFEISPKQNNCTNSPITVTDKTVPGFNANNPGNPGLYNRQFTIIPSTGWTILAGTLTSPSFVVKFDNPGEYDIILSAQPGGSSPVCLPHQDTMKVTIGESPVADFNITASPAAGCAPLTVNTVNNSIGDSLNYNWSVTPANGWNFTLPATAASAEPVLEFTQAGTYTISLNASNACALASTKDTVIVVKGLPTATLPAATAYCGPTTVTFINADSLTGTMPSGLNHEYSYTQNSGTITGVQWSVTGDATFVNGTTAGSFAPEINFPAAGVYTVSLEAINECGNSVVATQTITINPTAQVMIGSAESVICVGETATLTASGTDTYNWLPAPGLSASANPAVTVNSTATTTYTVIGTNNTGCADTATIVVDVMPLPVIQATASQGAFCHDQGSATLTATGANEYVWSPAGGLSADTGSVVIATPAANTIYTVTGTENTFGCSNTATVLVTVHPKPVVSAGADSVVCDQPVPVQLTGTPAGGTWSGTGVTASGVFVPSAVGLNTFVYSYTDANGCSNSDTMTVEVMNNPVANAGADTTICRNTPALALQGWPAGGTWSGASQVTSSGIFTPNTTGTFTLTYSFAPGSSCASTDQVIITVLALPAAPVASGATVCFGDSAQLTASAPGAVAINWYKALMAGPSQGIFLSTGPNFGTPSLTASTFYNIYATDTNGCVSPKTQVQVAVTPQVPMPTVAGVELCGPGNTATLTATAPGGTYSWFNAATGGTLLGTGATFTSAPNAATTTFYVEAMLGQCSSHRQAVTATVYPVIANNTANSNQTICYGNTPAALASAAPTGGNGTYTYQWQMSTSGATAGFLAAAGSNNQQNYAPAALTQTTWFRRLVTSGPCAGDVSNVVEITVMPALGNNSIAAAQTICAGDVPAVLTGSAPSGGNGSYTYLWESKANGASGFSPAAGVNNQQDYAPAALTQTTVFRRKVMSMACEVSVSATVQITVNPIISNNTATPALAQICEGAAAGIITGSAPAGGNGSYTFLWQISTTGATAGFAAAPGANNNSSYTAGTLTQTTWYRRVITSGPCADTSVAVVVNVTPSIADNMINQDQEICFGATPATLTGTTPTGGNGNYAYTWESSTTSATAGFGLAPGINNNGTYSPPALSATTWFRRKASSGACSVTSNVLKVTVNPVLANNFISASQTIFSGQVPAALTGTTPAGGNGSYTYLWESSTSGQATGFAAATGINNAAVYAPGALTETTWYRRIIISGGCTLVSDPIVITIVSGITGNSIQEDQQVCINSAPALFVGSAPAGGIGTYGYQWEYSTDGPAGIFVTAPGNSTAADYQSAPLSVNTWFRRKVTSGTYSHISNMVKVTVVPGLDQNSISFAQTICTGSVPEALTGTSPTGGTGSYTYLWESSVVGATSGFITAAGQSNQPNYVPGALSQPTWFRRTVFSGSCDPLISEAVLIHVNPVPVAPIVAGIRICFNTSASLFAVNPTGKTTDVLEWYDSAEGGSLLATGTSFVTPVLQQTTIFYVQIVNQSCTSERVAVEVQVTEAAANAGPDVSIIAGNSVQLQGSGGMEYTWTPGATLSSTKVNNPIAQPLITTEYTLIVKSEEGCISSDQVTVTVLQQVEIPNTFSPNNDRINDTWVMANIEKFPNANLQVYNQWGELVHTDQGFITPWDGTSKGKILPIATYYYILNLDGFEKPLSGSITIIR